jgi:hypothetical protein
MPRLGHPVAARKDLARVLRSNISSSMTPYGSLWI